MDFGIHGGQGFLWPIPHRYQETAICTNRLSRKSFSFSLFVADSTCCCCDMNMPFSRWPLTLALNAQSGALLAELSPQELKIETYRWHAIQERTILPERCVPSHRLDCCYEGGRGKVPIFSLSIPPIPHPPRGVCAECNEVQSTWQCQVDSGEKLQGCEQSEWNGLEHGSGRWLLLKSSWW